MVIVEGGGTRSDDRGENLDPETPTSKPAATPELEVRLAEAIERINEAYAADQREEVLDKVLDGELTADEEFNEHIQLYGRLLRERHAGSSE